MCAVLSCMPEMLVRTRHIELFCGSIYSCHHLLLHLDLHSPHSHCGCRLPDSLVSCPQAPLPQTSSFTSMTCRHSLSCCTVPPESPLSTYHAPSLHSKEQISSPMRRNSTEFPYRALTTPTAPWKRGVGCTPGSIPKRCGEGEVGSTRSRLLRFPLISLFPLSD